MDKDRTYATYEAQKHEPRTATEEPPSNGQ